MLRRIAAVLAIAIAGVATAQSSRYPPSGAGGSVSTINTTSPISGGPITSSGTLSLTTVPVTVGGTGDTSFTANAVVAGNGTGPLAVLANNGTATQKFLAQVSAGAPAWSLLVSGDIPVPLDLAKTYTTVAATDGAVAVTTVVTAHANNDQMAGIYSNPTFASGGHSGTLGSAAYLSGNSALALTLKSDGNDGIIQENYSGSTETMRFGTNGYILADGAGTSSAANPIYGSLQDSHSGMYISGSTVLFSTASTERARITNTGLGVGTTPTAKLDIAGTVKLGTTGVAFTAMGSCSVGSSTPSTTPANVTCTGVPASTAVAVTCSPSAAFSTAAGDALFCRPTGTADTLACNTTVANVTAVTLVCSWIQP